MLAKVLQLSILSYTLDLEKGQEHAGDTSAGKFVITDQGEILDVDQLPLLCAEVDIIMIVHQH